MAHDSTGSRTGVDRPVFVIGTGRSGTTLLFDILHRHPEVAWPCQFMVGTGFNRADRRVCRLKRLPLIGPALARSMMLRRPVSEPYELWDRFDTGFRAPCRDLTADDLHGGVGDQVRSAFAAQTQAMDKPRFITKYTGWARTRYVDAIFPDARYVHIVRDGRATAYSLMCMPWWRGWHGPSQWRWGELNDEDRAIWERSGRSFYVLAGLQWKILMANLTACAADAGQRCCEVRYETLVAEPTATIRHILQWADLNETESYMTTIAAKPLINANAKWRSKIGPAEQDRFSEALGATLERYGYA